jgi:hypothetical protein
MSSATPIASPFFSTTASVADDVEPRRRHAGGSVITRNLIQRQ